MMSAEAMADDTPVQVMQSAMTIRQLKQRNRTRALIIGGMRPAVTGSEQKPWSQNAICTSADSIDEFPPRPDDRVLNASIPLFYLARDKHGFWLAREADGRSGGIFLCKRSAVRFAGKMNKSAGYATRVLDEPHELDVENQGSRIIARLAAGLDAAARRMPILATFFAAAFADWRKLTVRISQALVGERRNREAIERELFRGHYRLLSKNDDDLPIP